MEDHVTYFENVIDACAECGVCAKIQEQSGCYVRNYADFARDMLEAIDSKDFENVTDPAWACTLCGACTARCPAHIDAYEFVFRARNVLNPEQPSIVQQFAPLRTDLESNSFAQLRTIRKPAFPDALEEGSACEKLFFPGCSLGTYAPELTAAVFRHLNETEEADGVSYSCCGNPFYFMGDPQLLRQSASALASKLDSCGVKQIVTACPSCYAALCSYQRDGILDETLSITPLPVILADQGMTVSPQAIENAGFDTLSIKDACRDRNDGAFATSVRQILGNAEVIELKHNRRNSRCCGSGGLVPLFDPEMSDDKRWLILEEFDNTEASCLVTMCINCSLALRQDGDTNIMHYLELLFEQPVDWDALEQDMAKL